MYPGKPGRQQTRGSGAQNLQPDYRAEYLPHTPPRSRKTAEFYRERDVSVKRATKKWRGSAGFARSDRIEQRFGRDLRIEHAEVFPEGEAAAGGRAAGVVVRPGAERRSPLVGS